MAILRENCKRVLKAWREGKECRSAEAIWTDGETIFSYKTALVGKWGGQTILNMTRYSKTTTVHQNALAEELEAFVVDDIRKGGGLSDLRYAAQ